MTTGTALTATVGAAKADANHWLAEASSEVGEMGITTASPDFESRASSLRFPPSIPRSQAYFWTAAWQAEERRADEEIRAGRTMRFSDPNAAVRWLLEDDD